MDCAFCRHANAAAARTCARCGAPLSQVRSTPDAARPTPTRDADLDRTVARNRLPGVDAAVPPPHRGPVGPAAPAARRPAAPSPQPAAPAAAPTPKPPAVATTTATPGREAPTRPGAGLRFAGALLDALTLSAVNLSLQLITGFTVPEPRTPDALAAYLRAMATVAGVSGLIALVYLTVGNALGRTLGKALVGTRVVDYRTGDRLSWGRALLRAAMMGVLALPAGLGFLSVLGRDGRGWHDLVAHSLVVLADPAPTLVHAPGSAARTAPITR